MGSQTDGEKEKETGRKWKMEREREHKREKTEERHGKKQVKQLISHLTKTRNWKVTKVSDKKK